MIQPRGQTCNLNLKDKTIRVEQDSAGVTVASWSVTAQYVGKPIELWF